MFKLTKMFFDHIVLYAYLQMFLSFFIEEIFFLAAYCPGGCLNGGKCGKTGKCVCPTGYTGLRCETKYNYTVNCNNMKR